MECNGDSTAHTNATTKKILKIKVWDEHDPDHSSIISVEVNAPTRRQDLMNSDERLLTYATLGIGEVVQIRQHDASDDGLPIVELWQSTPLSESNNEITTPPSLPPRPISPLTHAEEKVKSTRKNSINSKTFLSQSKLEPFLLPNILSASIVKRTSDQKVGLAFRKAKGVIVLEKITAGSAFEGSGLRPGMECLCINDHWVRSARKAAEVVRETTTNLTLLVSNAPRPPGTMYTIIDLRENEYTSGDEAAGGEAISSSALGVHFELNQGLVQLVKVDGGSPLANSALKVGDYILAIGGIVTGTVESATRLLSEQTVDMVPILYFSMKLLRVSLVDKMISDSWKREWSETYEECVVLPPTGKTNPLTLRFRENGTCELVDPLRAFRLLSHGHRDKAAECSDSLIPSDHPLNSIVDTLNTGITCVMEAIRQGVEKQCENEVDVQEGQSKVSEEVFES